MNVGAWNCRGTKKSKKLDFISKFFNENLLDVCFIMETKASCEESHDRIRKLGLSNYYIHPVVGRSGGLWLIWKDSVKIEVLKENKFYLHTKIEILSSQKEVFITFLHAPSSPEPRVNFWKDFAKLDPKNKLLCYR